MYIGYHLGLCVAVFATMGILTAMISLTKFFKHHSAKHADKNIN